MENFLIILYQYSLQLENPEIKKQTNKKSKRFFFNKQVKIKEQTNGNVVP